MITIKKCDDGFETWSLYIERGKLNAAFPIEAPEPPADVWALCCKAALVCRRPGVNNQSY